MPGSFATYRALGRRTVQGWLEPQALDVLSTLGEAQRSAGVVGAVAEIGVHRGKLLIALQLLNDPGLPTVAIDVFGDQELNVDRSGRGDLGRFAANVRRWADWEQVVVHRGDSTALTGADVRRLAQGPVRFFSVDGGHSESTVVADLRTAEEALAPGGIIIGDDVFNAEWPSVSVATMRFLDADPTVVPFAIGFNKVFFTDAAHADRYRAAIRADHANRWRIGHKTSEFHGNAVEVLWAMPPTPRSALRGNRLARRLYESVMTRPVPVPDGVEVHTERRPDE